jgi:DNA processing protein
VTTASRRFVSRSELDTLCADRLASSRLAGLYAAGSIECLAAPTVAIVGSRAPSDAGRRLAHRLAAELGAAGVCVISGLALGIDGAAHAGSLAAGAPTIGVLGGGHDHFFPARNRELAARMIAGGGAVVSPYAPDIPARPHQFLARNGVVAALADALVVVEAAGRSGALNTASWAADRSIPVMAFPGDVDRPKVAGCLALIRDGAVLVRGAADVLAGLGLAFGRSPPPEPVPKPDSELGRRIVQRLAQGPAGIDALLLDGRDAAALPAALLLACIGELLVSGAIVETDDGTLRLSGASR